MVSSLSVNWKTMKIVKKMIDEQDSLGLSVENVAGATVIDAGVDTRGGYAAGKHIVEVSMGGLGSASVAVASFGNLNLPATTVETDSPSVALFGAQYAGWRINVEKYFAMGSGPARALALKPKEMYTRIGYRDEADTATIVLESGAKPTKEAVEYIAGECGVSPEKLYIIVVSTSSVAGSTQISGRVVETGFHKLVEEGMDPQAVLSAIGYAPIAPVHPKPIGAMGRTNDMILYGGVVLFNVSYGNDAELKRIVEATPSSNSKSYGRLFAEVFKDAGRDFYKIDVSLFAPAVVAANNVKSGKIFNAGKINVDVLKQSLET